MRAIAHRYPLRMMFSERKNDEFVVDVAVVIVDRHGNKVFELPDAGPMLYVGLPDGHYTVSARFRDRTQSGEVTLGGKSSKDLYFHRRGSDRA